MTGCCSQMRRKLHLRLHQKKTHCRLWPKDWLPISRLMQLSWNVNSSASSKIVASLHTKRVNRLLCEWKMKSIYDAMFVYTRWPVAKLKSICWGINFSKLEISIVVSDMQTYVHICLHECWFEWLPRRHLRKLLLATPQQQSLPWLLLWQSVKSVRHPGASAHELMLPSIFKIFEKHKITFGQS